VSLRRWQAEALPLCLAAIARNERRVVQACTGSGKSVLQAEVLRHILSEDPAAWAVVTVPTSALVEQLAATFAGVLGEGNVGRYYMHAKQPDRRVVVCCVASLPRFVSEALDAGRGRPRVWLADEAHKAIASEPVRLAVDALNPLARLGFTATPWRSDGPMPGWTAPLLFRYRLADALADGVVVPADVVTWHREDDGVDSAVLELLELHKPEGPGIVSADRIEDAVEFAQRLTLAGWPAAAVSGLTSKRDLAVYLGWLRDGRLRCLVHVDLLTEGVDLPWLRWLVLRRARSARGLVQEAGRVLRVADGKTRATIFDPLALCPLQAFSTPERLGQLEDLAAEEEEAARGKTDAELEVMRLEAIATAAVEVDAFAAMLVSDALALGLNVEAQRVTGEARRLPATDRQRADLRRLGERAQGPISRLPERTRNAVRELAKSPEHLPRGAAADLIGVLRAVGQRVAETLPPRPSGFDFGRAWRWSPDCPSPTLDKKHVNALI
jgi:type I site-specific restriction endonuclease